MSYDYALKLVDWTDEQTCAVCLKVFKDENARLKHKGTVHTQQPQKFQCDQCARSYSNKDDTENM